MIQLNLLPDVKIEYLRTARNKRLVMGASLLVIAVSVGVMLLLTTIVYGFQKENLKDLNVDIVTYNKQLKDTPDLDKVLTIQNQLAALTGLHEKKVSANRLFPYLTQLTPSAASISQMDMDVESAALTIEGNATSLDVANTYIDTLKFTTFQEVTVDGETGGSEEKAFSNVVMTQFTRNSTGATFTITCNYEPKIFDNTLQVKLTVPKIVSTRSLTEQPTDLFTTDKGGQ
jgi:hypothetical protein